MRRGAFVVVAGPDGSGKSTLAHALAARSGDGLRLHGRQRVGSRRGVASTAPHAGRPYGAAASWAKLAYLYVGFLLGWLLRIRPAVRRGRLVVAERGWWDVLADGARYRLDVSPRAVRVLGRLLPRADLLVVLDASPQDVRARKPELDAAEIERQTAFWRALAADDPPRALVLDATADPDALCERVFARLGATREAAGLALRSVGRGRHAVLRRDGRPRFVLPAGVGAPGPWSVGLVRPAGLRQRAAAAALEAAQRSGATLIHSVRGAREQTLARQIAGALGLRDVELAASTVAKAGGERVVLAVRHGGRTVAFAKVGDVNPGGLAREHDVLSALADARPRSFRAPRPLALLDGDGTTVLLVERLPVRGRPDRPPAGAEIEALAELATLGGALAPVLGGGAGLVPVHGDFAGWNSAVVDGCLALWDWEEARLGLPLEDLFHWRTVEVVHFGRGTAAGLAASATSPDPQLRALCERLGLPPRAAADALRSYLERTLADPRLAAKRPHVLAVRRDALALLEAA